MRDHPRSRGVYHIDARKNEIAAGSSPLARGLQMYALTSKPRDGIIPARAGFTPSPARPCRPDADHPRSRGVYWDAVWGAVSGFGSSPLARGLPDCVYSRAHGARIIPARAGFTASSGRWLELPGDHPRSRGVYPRGTENDNRARGSSPLARGLHVRHAEVHHRRGIIPARAGFTWFEVH